MKESCRLCGRTLDGEDDIGWRYFGMICGSCFLPYAQYFLENLDGMEAEERLNQYSPGLCANG